MKPEGALGGSFDWDFEEEDILKYFFPFGRGCFNLAAECTGPSILCNGIPLVPTRTVRGYSVGAADPDCCVFLSFCERSEHI